jgi:uncharacterized membrane protein
MGKGRLEAFSDGVIAILITIMVLEFKTPHGHEWAEITALSHKLSAYVLSFVFLGIYWNNHHHMCHVLRHVTGAVLWANLHLLFWLSLVPFATAWMGESNLAPVPTAVYGAILLMSGVAFTILARTIMAADGPQSPLRAAFGADRKGWASMMLYAAAIPLAFVNPWISAAIYTGVAAMWLIPDRRIEKHLDQLT